MLPTLSGEFRLVEDPELRFTPTGQAVASARIVADRQKKIEKPDGSSEWVDDKVCWLRLTVWGRMAENFVESSRRGDLMEVRGTLETREYEDRDGNKRQSYDLTAYSVAMSLRFRQVLHTDAAGHKVTREGAAPEGTPSMEGDPWATPASSDEPPFSGGSW